MECSMCCHENKYPSGNIWPWTDFILLTTTIVPIEYSDQGNNWAADCELGLRVCVGPRKITTVLFPIICIFDSVAIPVAPGRIASSFDDVYFGKCWAWKFKIRWMLGHNVKYHWIFCVQKAIVVMKRGFLQEIFPNFVLWKKPKLKIAPGNQKCFLFNINDWCSCFGKKA